MNSSTRKTVLITGCSSGIGRDTAKLFQANGWQVAATMRTPADEEELNQLENVICLRLDVYDVKSIESAVKTTINTFGHIDVLVYNASKFAVEGFTETLIFELENFNIRVNVD